jgi:hypothetical protein
MACLSPTQRAYLQADLVRINSQLEKAYESFDRALEAMDVEEYRFNSGEGSQQTKQYDIKKINVLIESLESRRDKIVRKLEGRGLVNMNLRRKQRRGIYR